MLLLCSGKRVKSRKDGRDVNAQSSPQLNSSGARAKAFSRAFPIRIRTIMEPLLATSSERGCLPRSQDKGGGSTLASSNPGPRDGNEIPRKGTGTTLNKVQITIVSGFGERARHK